MAKDDLATREQAGALDKIGPMGRVLMGFEPPQPLDPEHVSTRIRERVLKAETPEELFAAGKAWNFDDLLGEPLEVKSAYLLPSRLEGKGPRVFMVLELTNLRTGEEIVASTSAQNIMDSVAVASDRGWAHFRFKVRRAEHQTTAGYLPYIVESV